MLRFDLPYTDSSLLLTPRFGGQSAVVQALLLAACFAPVVLVGWLYRYELLLARRSVARVLLVLRASLVGEAVDVTARLMEVASGPPCAA